MYVTIRIMTIIFLLATFHLHYNTKNRVTRDTIFGVMVWIVFFHNLTIFPIWFFSLENYSFIHYSAPFCLLYGPILYFDYQASISAELSRRSFLLHGFPVMAGWLAYFIFVFNPDIREQWQTLFYPVLFTCMGISLIAYPVYIFSKPRQSVFITKIVYFSWFYVLVGLFIFFIVIKMIIHPLHDNQFVFKNNRIASSLCMFFCVLTLFVEAFQRFSSGSILEYISQKSRVFAHIGKGSHKQQPNDISLQSKTTTGLQMLDHYFSSDAIQNADLDLKTAASQLGITQKKLSELIHGLYGTTFVKLLIKKRIQYACRILLSPEFDDSYERMPLLCGFKSSASFYRHFRAMQHCSPTEFRHQYFEPAERDYTVSIK